jgi:glycosyltransferase involved in cell wall biosynthesis
MHADSRVAVVIPAYEVVNTIRAVVTRTQSAMARAQVIVVDDGSTDGTGDAARGLGPETAVRSFPRNRGKGAALREGIDRALAHGASLIVTLDADGQHPPEEIPRLLEPIRKGRADLVLGARRRNGPMPIARRLSNWLSAGLATRIGGQPVIDAQTGFRAFTRAVAEQVRPVGDRYEYEANFLFGALKSGFRILSVEVPTIYGSASHFRTWTDTWRVARVFARHMV